MTAYKRVFLDTAPVIYYLQHDKEFFDRTKDVLVSLIRSRASFVTSDMTIEEYCVYPYRQGKHELVDAFDRFLTASKAEIVHSSETIAKKAARIRAEYHGFKGMDSLQLATAVISGCDLFLTNDKQLRRFSEISCMTVDDIASQRV